MKRKELKNIAKEIAKCEIALQNPDLSSDERNKLEEQMMNICGKADSLTDMMLIDDMVQELISKNSEK